MPIVCIERPNRTKPRHFTEKDLERIAKTMVSQGHLVRNIVATVLIATGFAVLICLLAGAMQRTLGVMRIIQQIAGLLAGAALTRVLIIWLSRVAQVPVPGLPVIIGWIIAMLLVIQALQEGAITLVDDVMTIESMTATVDDWCDAIKEKITL